MDKVSDFCCKYIFSPIGKLFTCSFDNQVCKVLKRNLLLFYTILAVAIGIGLGFIMRSAEFTDLQRYYWAFPGDVMMMNMLKCIIVPLIVLSITTGVASLAASSGKISKTAIIYYLSTTFLAIVLGIVITLAIKPGKGIPDDDIKTDDGKEPQAVADGLLDIVRNMFPPNIVSAMFQQAKSSRSNYDDPSKSKVNVDWFKTGGDKTVTYIESVVRDDDGKVTAVVEKNMTINAMPSFKPSQNVLGLITFCIVFGFYLGKLAHKGNKACKNALELLNGMNDAIMAMVDLVMCYVPIGLIFLISNKIMAIDADKVGIWGALGKFIATSLTCLVIHGLIFLPAIYYIVIRKNPFTFMKGVSQALATAFGNASSAATMPVTLRNLEHNNKVDPRVIRFMVPIGATINMDGTALYEAVAALFIAQLVGKVLTFGEIVTIAVTATAASIGAAAVPSAGLITLVMVLGAIGLPTDQISWIFTVDWFLDRFRTATNVWGDCVGTAVVQHMCRDELEKTELEFVSDGTNNEAYE